MRHTCGQKTHHFILIFCNLKFLKRCDISYVDNLAFPFIIDYILMSYLHINEDFLVLGHLANFYLILFYSQNSVLLQTQKFEISHETSQGMPLRLLH